MLIYTSPVNPSIHHRKSNIKLYSSNKLFRMKFGDEAEKGATEEITEDKEIIGLAQDLNLKYREMKEYVEVECKYFTWISFQKNHNKKSRKI